MKDVEGFVVIIGGEAAVCEEFTPPLLDHKAGTLFVQRLFHPKKTAFLPQSRPQGRLESITL